MVDVDPFATRRDSMESVGQELVASGFERVQEIGRGGFGIVYRCQEPALDRVVAVKVLTSGLDEQSRARFFREQKASGRLTGHPNIVEALHVGETASGKPFIVMPYYVQDSLAGKLRRQSSLSMAEVLRIGVKISGALASAHRFGVVHRDVKPGNILLTNYNEPALSDFGISHFIGSFETETGVVTGSPAFMAPEVASGAAANSAADVYGLGATLFAAITGHLVYERRSGEKLVAQFLRIAAESVPDPRAYGIPDDVARILEEGLAGDPSARPSAEVFGRKLQESQRNHGLTVDEMFVYSMSLEVRSTGDMVGDSSLVSSGANKGMVDVQVPPRIPILPLELTSFVDRKSELTRVRSLLSTARLVTLTGIGGVGKTRLAIRVASTTSQRSSGGVVLVELGELHDGALVSSVVAGALGIRDRSARSIDKVLVDFLSDRQLLMVLDNCEQVVEAVAKIADFLLRNCADLTILATSREPIGIGGEAVLLVPPLPVPDDARSPRATSRNDAVKLFVDRAAGALPGFELTEDNSDIISQICRRLDGLPLPIELAAARLRVMSADQILERLTERFSLLVHGSRAAPSRQQTMQVCIDWSYDLCTEIEQEVWSQLSVFSGGFTVPAAEQVCSVGLSSVEFIEVISSLVEKSILIRVETRAAVRFRMLDTVRDYGREKVQAAGIGESLRGRHCDWCEGLAVAAEAEWIGPRQIEWINIIIQEQSNVREASEFCVHNRPEVGSRMAAALLSFWISQGGATEGRRWLSRFADRTNGPPTAEQAKAVHAGVLGAAVQGDLPTATALVKAGLALSQQSSDSLLRAHIDHAVGDAALFSGRFLEARVHLERAVEGFARRKLLHLRIMATLTLGLTCGLLQESARAIEYYEEILAITEAHGETMYRTYALWALAIAQWHKGEHGQAIRLLENALRLLRKVNDRLSVSMCLQVLAWIAAEHANETRAAVLLGASEGISRSVGSSIVVLPGLTSFQDGCEYQVRSALGSRAFNQAHRKGIALGFHDAISFALHEQRPRTSTSQSGTHLTNRELEVSELVAEGLTNKEIAARLVISLRTAQGHVEHLLNKLGFTSRTQIATWVATSKSEPEGN
ncbi:MAG: serine/threonine-protein kinase PknK [Rhodococcus sp. (in: high G+C Gram-positive bacteria)]|jgi:serine/threonine-protein kinase PknK